jgi:hypothetical protein
LSNPGEAVFGVFGLDRKTVWHRDPQALSALQSAARDPLPTSVLVRDYGQPLVRELVSRRWLQDPAELCVDYWLRSGQIEITAHCNWGCSYCPVAKDPKPREVMPLALFSEIVEKLSVHDTVEYVTFHFFNEPTLDPLFNKRICILRDHGLKLSLYSNASALTPQKIDLLVESGVIYNLMVNLPTLDEDEFTDMTGSRTYRQALRGLEYAINTQAFPVALSVNGSGAKRDRNVAELKERYECRGVQVNSWLTSDRAGALDGLYSQDVYVEGPLRGCSWPLNHGYFSVRGNMFACCNDYYQREVFGHISEGSVHDIMTSPAAIALRRRVFGVEQAPDDFLCRRCHDQLLDFPDRQFRPLHTFPLTPTGKNETSCPGGGGCCRG